MKKNLYLLFIAIAFGCETVVDVNVPLEAPKLTLNCIFTPDSVWTAKVSVSRHILDDSPFKPVTDALVVVYHNGAAYDTLEHLEDGKYTSPTNKKPVGGEWYEIRATAPGFGEAKSTSYSTTYAELKPQELKASPGHFEYNEFNHTLKVTFDDNSKSQDYYQFELFVKYRYFDFYTKDSVDVYHSLYIGSDETESDEGVIFDDLPFNGKTVTISIKAFIPHYNSSQASQRKFLLHFRKLSEDLYKFKSSSLLQTQSSGDPLVQPVHVYNNISNGYGIFGGYSERVYELQK